LQKNRAWKSGVARRNDVERGVLFLRAEGTFKFRIAAAEAGWPLVIIPRAAATKRIVFVVPSWGR